MLWVDAISFFVTRWCQKLQNIDENWWKLANIDRECLLSSKRLEEIQWNFQERCILR